MENPSIKDGDKCQGVSVFKNVPLRQFKHPSNVSCIELLIKVQHTHTHTHRFYSLHHCKFFLTEEHLWNMAHPLGETIHTSNSDEGVRWWFQIDPTNTQLAGFRLSRHPQRWRYSWFQYLSPSDPEPNLQISRWLCSAMVEASCHSRCPSS